MKSVYHYCSVDTFLKIIQGKTLRLSDIEKSNDYAERLYIEKKIHDEFIKRIEGEFSDEVKEKLLYTEDRCRRIMRKACVLYAICFSEEKDLLSQWRGYANDGKGVAIGFSKDALNSVNKDVYGLTFEKVCYDEKEQEKFAHAQVETIINTIQKKNLFSAFAEVYENEIPNMGCMKAPGFCEEKEWRLCISMTPEARMDCEMNFGDFVLSKVQEQCIRDQIVTYFDLSFEKMSDEIITDIVIGPNARVTEWDVQRSLFLNGFQAEKIVITKSKLTYRQ